METFSVLDSHSKKISNSLIFMVFPWGNAKSSDNGQDIEYWLKIVRIRCKFNVFLTSCVTAWIISSSDDDDGDKDDSGFNIVNFLCVLDTNT